MVCRNLACSDWLLMGWLLLNACRFLYKSSFCFTPYGSGRGYRFSFMRVKKVHFILNTQLQNPRNWSLKIPRSSVRLSGSAGLVMPWLTVV